MRQYRHVVAAEPTAELQRRVRWMLQLRAAHDSGAGGAHGSPGGARRFAAGNNAAAATATSRAVDATSPIARRGWRTRRRLPARIPGLPSGSGAASSSSCPRRWQPIRDQKDSRQSCPIHGGLRLHRRFAPTRTAGQCRRSRRLDGRIREATARVRRRRRRLLTLVVASTGVGSCWKRRRRRGQHALIVDSVVWERDQPRSVALHA